MDGIRRYAVYWAPPEGSGLAAAGAAWLGWDAARGAEASQPDLGADLGVALGDVTATPRKYGFHATIKAPFRALRPGVEAAFREAAAGIAAIEMPPLEVARMGPWLALRPSAPSAALQDFAARWVRALEEVRAAPGEADIARRRRAGLSPRQDAYLVRWGYPFVFEEFRFHMTLAGALEDGPAAAALEAAARDYFGPHLGAPVAVREACLFGEGADGKFRILERAALGG